MHKLWKVLQFLNSFNSVQLISLQMKMTETAQTNVHNYMFMHFVFFKEMLVLISQITDGKMSYMISIHHISQYKSL